MGNRASTRNDDEQSCPTNDKEYDLKIKITKTIYQCVECEGLCTQPMTDKNYRCQFKRMTDKNRRCMTCFYTKTVKCGICNEDCTFFTKKGKKQFKKNPHYCDVCLNKVKTFAKTGESEHFAFHNDYKMIITFTPNHPILERYAIESKQISYSFNVPVFIAIDKEIDVQNKIISILTDECYNKEYIETDSISHFYNVPSDDLTFTDLTVIIENIM